MQQKLEWLSPKCPLGPLPSFAQPEIAPEAVREEAGVAQPLSSPAS